MTKEDILNFQQSIQNLSLAELEDLAEELRVQISKMILDSDIVAKASLVDALLKEKKGA